MIRICILQGAQQPHKSRCLATRMGVVETLAIIGDFAFASAEVDRAWLKLRGYLDAYNCDPDEGAQIVIHAGDRAAQPTDTIEIRMMGAVERYTLLELRECWREVSETA